MDEESKQLLRQLIDLQKEHLELVRKNLLPLSTRIRFSMLALLVLMTVMGVALGIITFVTRLQDDAATQWTSISPFPPITDTADDIFGPTTADPDIDLP